MEEKTIPPSVEQAAQDPEHFVGVFQRKFEKKGAAIPVGRKPNRGHFVEKDARASGPRLRISADGIVVAWDADRVYVLLRKWARRYYSVRLREIVARYGAVSTGVKQILSSASQLLAAARHLRYMASHQDVVGSELSRLYTAEKSMLAEVRQQEMAAEEMAKADAAARKREYTVHEAISAGLLTEGGPSMEAIDKAEEAAFPAPNNSQVKRKRGRPRKYIDDTP